MSLLEHGLVVCCRSSNGSRHASHRDCCLTAFVTCAAHAGDRITGEPFATRSEVIAQHGMVATSHPLATQIGLDVLKKGGTAVDAAIAANAALGLMEPVSNGVGGDLFAIVWDAKTKKLYGYNGSGRSPKSLTLKWFQDHGYKAIPPLGPLPVNVPGCGRRLVRAARALRQAADEGRSRAAIALRARRLPGDRADRVLLEPRRCRAWRNSPASPSSSRSTASAPAKGEIWKNPNLAQHARGDRERRPRRVLQGRDRAHDRRLHEGATAASCPTRISPRTRANGSSRCRPTIAATTSGSCRRTGRASRRCRC